MSSSAQNVVGAMLECKRKQPDAQGEAIEPASCSAVKVGSVLDGIGISPKCFEQKPMTQLRLLQKYSTIVSSKSFASESFTLCFTASDSGGHFGKSRVLDKSRGNTPVDSIDSKDR